MSTTKPGALTTTQYPLTSVSEKIITKKTFKLKSLHTNWNKYNELLENSYINFFSVEYEALSPRNKYFFVKTLTEAIKLSTPTKKDIIDKTKLKNPVPWWDSECNNIRSLRRSSFKVQP